MSSGQRLDLLVSRTTNGSGSELNWLGGRGKLFFTGGTFDSASIQVEIQAPDTRWMPLGTAATSEEVQDFHAPKGKMRATVSSAGGSTSVNCYAVAVPPG